MDEPVRKVVCAACRHSVSERMIVGPRHFDPTMRAQIEIMRRAYGVESRAWEQGFIDQFGVFMDREEALQVAKASGQPLDMERNNGGIGGELYSEGLY